MPLFHFIKCFYENIRMRQHGRDLIKVRPLKSMFIMKQVRITWPTRQMKILMQILILTIWNNEIISKYTFIGLLFTYRKMRCIQSSIQRKYHPKIRKYHQKTTYNAYRPWHWSMLKLCLMQTFCYFKYLSVLRTYILLQYTIKGILLIYPTVHFLIITIPSSRR